MKKDTIIQLVEKLIEKTRNDRAIWNQSARQSLFMLDFENGRITIDEVRKKNFTTIDHMVSSMAASSDSIEVTIYNDVGDTLAHYATSPLDRDELAKKLISLYDGIKDKYAKEDEAMENFLREIDDKEVVGRKGI